MTFYVARAGQEIGADDRAAFESKMSAGIYQPSDHYWSEGMTDWLPVSTYRSTVAQEQPAAALPKAKRTRNPAAIGALLALAASFAPLVWPGLFFLFSLPALFAAFVLAIVALAKTRVLGGLALLAFLLPAMIWSWMSLVNRDELLHHKKTQVETNR